MLAVSHFASSQSIGHGGFSTVVCEMVVHQNGSDFNTPQTHVHEDDPPCQDIDSSLF